MEFEYTLEDFEGIDSSLLKKEGTESPAPVTNLETPELPITEMTEAGSSPDNDEALLNYWLEKGLIMINPDEDEINSIDEALEIDARRRSELIEIQMRDYLVQSFPEDFKIIADAVINQGVGDVKTLLNLFKEDDIQTPQEVNEKTARAIVEKHYKEKLNYDEDLLDVTIETLITKNKLVDTAKQIEKVELAAKEEKRRVEVEKEVQRQIEAKKQIEAQNQRYLQTINQEIESRSWSPNIKKEVQQEYLAGTTVEKIKDLLQDPYTAPDIAMLIHQLYEKDKNGKIRLNLNSVKNLVSSQMTQELKQEQKKKAFNFRFGSLKKANDEFDLSEWEK